MNFQNFVLIGLLLCGGGLWNSAVAGDASHGALGWVCRDENGAAVFAELYEIANAPESFSVAKKYEGISHEAGLEIFAGRLRNSADWSLSKYWIFINTYRYLFNNKEELPKGHRIQFDRDAFGEIATYDENASCKPEMIAHTLHAVTRIDMELYNLLNWVNKIAFWLHETVYFIATQITEPETADPIRKLVRMTLDENTKSRKLKDEVDRLLPSMFATRDAWGTNVLTILIHAAYSKKDLALQAGPEAKALELERVSIKDLREGDGPRLMDKFSSFYPRKIQYGTSKIYPVAWEFPDRSDLKHKVLEMVLSAKTGDYENWSYTKLAASAKGFSQNGHKFSILDSDGDQFDHQTYVVRMVFL